MAARWPNDVDELVGRIDGLVDDAGSRPLPPGSFTGGCTCLMHVLARTVTGHAARASLAPLLPRRWRS